MSVSGNNDVRIAVYSYEDRPLTVRISFYNDKQTVFESERVSLMAKGHRLYFKGGERGYKLSQGGNVLIIENEYSQRYRKFEGEYELMFDGENYYIDLDKVSPLADKQVYSMKGYRRGYNTPTNRDMQKVTSHMKQEEVNMDEPTRIEEKPISYTEVNVIEYLKNKALELLLSGKTEDASTVASTIRIIGGMK